MYSATGALLVCKLAVGAADRQESEVSCEKLFGDGLLSCVGASSEGCSQVRGMENNAQLVSLGEKVVEASEAKRRGWKSMQGIHLGRERYERMPSVTHTRSHSQKH